MRDPETPRPPRIVIERTPANDVYLILDRLLPDDRVAALLRDPDAFLAEHAAELRFLRQALAARLGPSTSPRGGGAGRATPAPGAAAPDGPAARPAVEPAPGTGTVDGRDGGGRAGDERPADAFLDHGHSLLR